MSAHPYRVVWGGVEIARTTHAESAAAVVTLSGGQIYVGRTLLWDDDSQPSGSRAEDSLDLVAATVYAGHSALLARKEVARG